MASTEVKRAVDFTRKIVSRKPDIVEGWIEATLECGHVVSYCTPSVKFLTLHCGECVNAYLLAARTEARAAQVGAVSVLEVEAYPCMKLPPDQRCNYTGAGGFMGHTCTRLTVETLKRMQGND